MHGHERNAGLGNARLFEGDAAQRIVRRAVFRCQEEAFVVDAERSNSAGGQHFGCQDIGRIEPPAEAHFYYAGIGRRPAEGEERSRNRHFEKARRQIFSRVQDFLQ